MGKPDWDITFLDSGREPQCPPNPAYPSGMTVDMSRAAKRTCSSPVPYPAPRCGQYIIYCKTCKTRVLITVAGRADDPRYVKLACKVD